MHSRAQRSLCGPREHALACSAKAHDVALQVEKASPMDGTRTNHPVTYTDTTPAGSSVAWLSDDSGALAREALPSASFCLLPA